MRTKLTITLTLLIILVSCEKLEFKHDIIGNWRIFGSGGGITGRGNSYNFNFMSIKQGNDYQFIRNDTVIEKGTYKLIRNENESFKTLGDYAITFSAKNRLGIGASQITSETKIIQMVANDTIILADGYIDDGFGYYFARQ
jgi:hypothetical protein